MTTIKSIIYKITNNINGKLYIGQTKSHKIKNGKPYKYGIDSRFIEHIGAARRCRKTPIATAIRKYGGENFEIEEIKRCKIENSDILEAFYIAKFNSLRPNGYNVQRSSRVSKGNIHTENEIEYAEIKGIKLNRKLSLVRVYLKIKDLDIKRRINFGNENMNYDKSLKRARDFCNKLQISGQIVEHYSLFERKYKWEPYIEKINGIGEDIKMMRMVPFNKNLVRIYIRTISMESYKDQITFTFGGKFIETKEAIKTAFSVFRKILKTCQVYEYEIHKELSATGSCQKGCGKDLFG